MTSQARLAAIQRTDFPYFMRELFAILHPGKPPLQLDNATRAICHALEQTRVGDDKRLVINVPPRHLKSITASVGFCCWLLGHRPQTQILVGTYNAELAEKHARMVRTIMKHPWYRALFPATVVETDRALEITTTAGGFRKAVTTSGSGTGFGGDVIVLDDCMKALDATSEAARKQVEDWFTGTIGSRLNNKGEGVIISIQQRLHETDLSAFMLERGARHLNLPAIANKPERIPLGNGRFFVREPGDLLSPEREPQSVLDKLRRDNGPQVFSAQWMQNPVAPEGNILREEWFGVYEGEPEREWFHKVVQSWDTGMSDAPTSDYSVCTTWGFRQNQWYLVDVIRERLNYPDLKRTVILHRRQWDADCVVIERAGSGISLAQDLRTQGQLVPILWEVTEAKEERLIGCLGEIEAGNLLLPREAPWLDAFRSELRAFPFGRHDDQVDSMTQFIKFQQHNWKWVLNLHERGTGRLLSSARVRQKPW